ncbi:MAG TPA: hypothetical protein VFV97_04275 [Rhodanobacteraceae bacterium]|nr:hypothetical protein [Rhodanobacteraceae bacterium]
MQVRTVFVTSRVGSAVLALTAAMSMSSAAFAADGDLDPTFGTGGFTLTGLTTAGFELPAKPVVQPDGKILICSRIDSTGPSGSDFFIARFNPDGSPDTSFDFDGQVTVDFAGRNEGCNALALQADGKIVAIGSSNDGTPNSDFAVARLEANGSLDPTFGAGTGTVLVPFDIGGSNSDTAATVALQPDGKILVAGWAVVDGSGNQDFAVVRLSPDGTRDTTFNSTGRVTIAFDFAGTGGTDEADAILVDDAGRIIVGGIAETQPSSFGFALARLLPNGSLDHNFSADGRATIDFDLGASLSDISYQSILTRDGKIVMVGNADTGSGATTNGDVAIARVLPDGSPDATFGIGGKVTVPFDLITNGSEVATGVVEDSAGRLVVVGAAIYDGTNSFFHPFALRLERNGALDSSFGNFGKKTYDFGGASDIACGVAMQGTALIMAGISTTGTDIDNYVARLDTDLIFANDFD